MPSISNGTCGSSIDLDLKNLDVSSLGVDDLAVTTLTVAGVNVTPQFEKLDDLTAVFTVSDPNVTAVGQLSAQNLVSTNTVTAPIVQTVNIQPSTGTQVFTGTVATPNILVVNGSSSRVGVLNSSPSYTFDVTGSLHGTDILRIDNSSTSATGAFLILNTSTSQPVAFASTAIAASMPTNGTFSHRFGKANATNQSGNLTYKHVDTAGNSEVILSLTGQTIPAVSATNTTFKLYGVPLNVPIQVVAGNSTSPLPSIPITGLSTNANKITIVFFAVHLNGNNNIALRVGTSSGIVSSANHSYCVTQFWAPNNQNVIGSTTATAFYLTQPLNTSEGIYGEITFYRCPVTSTTAYYTYTGQLRAAGGPDNTIQYICSGAILLNNLITQLEIINPNSTSAFNNSNATIQVYQQ